MTKSKRPRINTAERIYKLYSEKGVGAACDYANKHNVPYEHCIACEADMPSKNHTCLICGQETKIIHPFDDDRNFIGED